MTTDDVIPPDFWKKLFKKALAPTLLLGIVGTATSHYKFAFVMGGLFVIATVGQAIFTEKRTSRATRIKKAKLERLDAELSTMHGQYKKNRRIAES